MDPEQPGTEPGLRTWLLHRSGSDSPQARQRWKLFSQLALAVAAALVLFGGIEAGLRLSVPNDSQTADHRSTDACKAYLGSSVKKPFSVIFTADPGEFSGVPEAHYIIANLVDRKNKPKNSTVCGGHYQGLLMGQPVLVVTTGIGPPAAGLCALEVLLSCGSHIKEILYFGTSGWSPQLGGVLNPPKCHTANHNTKITRLGDVCISPFTVNWTCKKSSWKQQAGGYPNQCYRPPEVASPNATILYGHCQFYKDNMEANLALADELLTVAHSHTAHQHIPTRSPAVSLVEQTYWSWMGNATGVKYPVPNTTARPTYWNYTQCMEVDGQFFYSGVPFEVKARDYAAETLTAALGEIKTSGDMIAVSAMEGIGVSEALLKYHALATTKKLIPYTNIRTLSNWLHQPVHQVSPGVWEEAASLPEDFVTGYGYAIATGSATIMSLYQSRCKQDVLEGRLAKDFDCNFEIDYNIGNRVDGNIGQVLGVESQINAESAQAQEPIRVEAAMPSVKDARHTITELQSM